MKINDIGGHGGPRRPEDAAGVEKREGTAASRRTEDRDRVELSETARQRLDLLKRAKGLPEVREKLIERLRSELETGDYRVDARKLAQAILEFEDGLRD